MNYLSIPIIDKYSINFNFTIRNFLKNFKLILPFNLKTRNDGYVNKYITDQVVFIGSSRQLRDTGRS